jgi:hypothetical protein
MSEEFGPAPSGSWGVAPAGEDGIDWLVAAWMCALGPAGPSFPEPGQYEAVAELCRHAETPAWYALTAADALTEAGYEDAGKTLRFILRAFGTAEPIDYLAAALKVDRKNVFGLKKESENGEPEDGEPELEETPAILEQAGLLKEKDRFLLDLVIPIFTGNMDVKKMLGFWRQKGLAEEHATVLEGAGRVVEMIAAARNSGVIPAPFAHFAELFEQNARMLRIHRILDMVTWWGVGGNGNINSRGEPGRPWRSLWDKAFQRLVRQVKRAIRHTDECLSEWVAELNSFSKPMLEAEHLAYVLLEPQDKKQSGALRLEYAPVPMRNDSPGNLQSDAEYREEWDKAGVSVIFGTTITTVCRPGTRYVFRVSDGALKAPKRPWLQPGPRIVVRSGDRLAQTDADPTVKGFDFRLSKAQRSIEFKGMVEAEPCACRCGTKHCAKRHHISSWDPERHPYVRLSNFVYVSVKGRPLRGNTLAAKVLNQGIYYPFLAAARHTTAPPIRIEDLAWFTCPHCDEKHQSRNCPKQQDTDGSFSAGCSGVAPSSRVFLWKIEDYSLKPYSRCKTSRHLYYISDKQICSDLRFKKFIGLHSPPGWSRWSREDKEQWASTLDPSHPLARFARAHWVAPPEKFDRNSGADALERITYACKQRFAYCLLGKEVIRAASRGKALSQREDDEKARLIAETCESNPWLFLLYREVPVAAGEGPSAVPPLYWEQAREIEKDIGGGPWCECGGDRLPRQFRALWTRE